MATIRIHGIPIDFGQNRRGVDMGPSAIRYAGLRARLHALGWHVTECGNVLVPDIHTTTAHQDDIPNAHNSTAIATVAHASARAMHDAIRADEIAIFLGGDHSCAIGTLVGSLQRPHLGVVWVDAHGDFNTPQTTPSGNVHGMVVSTVMGMCPAPLAFGSPTLHANQIVMIALRDLDGAERIALRASGILVFTMHDIDELGIATVMRRTLAHLANARTLHVSFDMDALDPAVAPGVGTPVSGGLSVREAHFIMEALCDDGRVRALDLVEVNPILDDHNRTAALAVDLAASLFGQRIL